ncbi:hypothetical protein EOPP23_10685 [Endozoicomonas sp. OPT23]|uniref:hypothetical protein n=1 Tax=Endozoicomonas sp. OPT23 TaxID=2072845 RepID=UPI00129A9F1C|nr:hypothetical protein [Endozoicomonas sp. OPT23]MRI33451.1 hypothetical protein [Endozoicomonas sp. OPT23]
MKYKALVRSTLSRFLLILVVCLQSITTYAGETVVVTENWDMSSRYYSIMTMDRYLEKKTYISYGLRLNRSNWKGSNFESLSFIGAFVKEVYIKRAGNGLFVYSLEYGRDKIDKESHEKAMSSSVVTESRANCHDEICKVETYNTVFVTGFLNADDKQIVIYKDALDTYELDSGLLKQLMEDGEILSLTSYITRLTAYYDQETGI